MKKLSVTTRTDAGLIAADVPTSRILEVELTAPEASGRNESAPLNLGLVIDRSGSMGGGKLEKAKEAVNQILDLMREKDSVSIVAYDDTVREVGTCRSVTESEKAELQVAVHRLRTGGSTNLGDGWLQGCESVARWLDQKKVNRTLLLSDGLANVGITSIEELTYHAAAIFERGITTSTFGIGEDFNQELLNGMSNRGGGNFYFIEHARQIPELLMQEFKGLTAVTARDVVVEITYPTGLSLELFGEWRSEQVPGKTVIRLSDLSANRTIHLFARLLTPPGTGYLVISVSATGFYEEGKTFKETGEVKLEYTTQDKVRLAPKDKDVEERFASVAVGNITNQALKLEKNGRRDEAHRLMLGMISEYGEHLPSSTRERYQRITNDIQHGFIEMDRKRMNYDSYQLQKHRHEEQEQEELRRRREKEKKSGQDENK